MKTTQRLESACFLPLGPGANIDWIGNLANTWKGVVGAGEGGGGGGGSDPKGLLILWRFAAKLNTFFVIQLSGSAF